jgi:signal transduction histidine kinase
MRGIHDDDFAAADRAARERRVTLVRGGAAIVAAISLGDALLRFWIEGWTSPVAWVLLANGLVQTAASVLAQRAYRFSTTVLLVGGSVVLLVASWVQDGPAALGVPFWTFPAWIAAYLLGSKSIPRYSFITVLGILGTLFFALAGVTEMNERSFAADMTLRSATALGAVVLGAVLAWRSERRWEESDAALRRSTARARAILDALPDAFLLLDTEGVVLDARIPASSPLARSADLTGRSVAEGFDPSDARRLLDGVAAVNARHGGQTVEIRIVTEDGPRDLEARLAAHADGQVIALMRDISEARRSRRAQDEFVAMVSHELRTPLTSIHGALGLLRGGVLTPGSRELDSVLDVAWRNSDRLRRIIDDLLDVQRMSLGTLELRPAPVDGAQLLRDAVAALDPYAQQFGVEVRIDPVPPAPLVVDVDRYQQVVGNLLSNAIKHSPRGGLVTLAADVGPDRFKVRVRDRGRGIPADFRHRVFEQFAQADGSVRREVGGTGLGLAISKRLVLAMGGSIGFTTADGEGTTFWFEIPRTAVSGS